MRERILARALDILKVTKEDNQYPRTDELTLTTLQGLEDAHMEETHWTVSRVSRIMLAQKALGVGAEIEEVIELLTWKDFEGFVAHILSENGFRCVESFRRRGTESDRGMEIDVVGVRGRIVIVADAKMWGIRSYKAAALKTAAENQKERTHRLIDLMDKIEDRLGGLSSGTYSLIPIIVTWLVEEVQIHDGVPIIPVFKLNSFLLSFDAFWDLMVSYPYQRP